MAPVSHGGLRIILSGSVNGVEKISFSFLEKNSEFHGQDSLTESLLTKSRYEPVFLVTYVLFQDLREKENLSRRSGGFFKYENYGNLLEPPRDAPGYCDTSQQFKISREQSPPSMTKSADRAIHASRIRESRAITRELQAAKRIRALELSDAATLEKLRDSGIRSKANIGGCAYNIINMKYLDTPDGTRLKRHDDLVRYRGQLRALNLAAKNHSGFDPITGAQTFALEVPRSPCG